MTRPSLAGIEQRAEERRIWPVRFDSSERIGMAIDSVHDVEALTAAVRDLLAAASDLDRHASRIVRAGDVADLIRTTIATHLDLTDPEGDPT